MASRGRDGPIKGKAINRSTRPPNNGDSEARGKKSGGNQKETRERGAAGKDCTMG